MRRAETDAQEEVEVVSDADAEDDATVLLVVVVGLDLTAAEGRTVNNCFHSATWLFVIGATLAVVCATSLEPPSLVRSSNSGADAR